MTSQKIAILNDTDYLGQHFGCTRVMRTLRGAITSRDAKIIGSLPVGMNWRRHPLAPALIDDADHVVINGEGTLHHGKKRGRWLLEAGQEAKRSGKRVSLVNTLWQDNPAEWYDMVREFDTIWCRDSQSASELSAGLSRPVPWTGDLSMYTPFSRNDATLRESILVGDSVDFSVSKRLADLSTDIPGAIYSPLMSRIKFVAPHLSKGRAFLRNLENQAYMRLWRRRYDTLRLVDDDMAYLDMLSCARHLITGRYHAVCLAILTQTPFTAIPSNSWKIEALISDIGLSFDRVVPKDKISSLTHLESLPDFSAQELDAISAKLSRWRIETDRMFDEMLA